MWFKKEKINTSLVLKFGVLGGGAEAIYCLTVALVISFLVKVMSKTPPTILSFLLLLLLLVFSVGVSGLLVFGYPAYLAFQKRFAESVMTAAVSLVTLVVIGVLTSIVIFSL